MFQGRFKAILIDRDSYLLEVCRYVDLNPVRARMVKHPDAYAWSSYRALAGLEPAPVWLDAQPLYTQLAPGKSAERAADNYARFVAEGKHVALWDTHLRQQIFLGDDAFITRMQKLAGIDGTAAPGRAHKAQVSKIHLTAPTHGGDLHAYTSRRAANRSQRNRNIADAFYQGGHSPTAIASAFGVSTSTVSRVVIGFERGEGLSGDGRPDPSIEP